MHNNVKFLNRLSSNAYEFDKRERRFHLRKSVVTFAKELWFGKKKYDREACF